MENRSDDDKYVQQFTEAVSMGDDARLKGLLNAEALLTARHNALTEQREWLAAKYGDKHPLIGKMDKEHSSNLKFFKAMSAEIVHSAIKPQRFQTTGWRVQGRVLDKENKPVADIGVFLSEENEKQTPAIKPVNTDQWGFFAITFDESMIKQLNGQKVVLHLSDQKIKVLSVQDALTPKAGIIEYRDIFVESADKKSKEHYYK